MGMNNQRYHTSDYSTWSQEFESIDSIYIRSLRSFINLTNVFDRRTFGYIMLIGSTDLLRTYVYGQRICNSVSLVHDPKHPQELKQLRGKNVLQIDYGDDFFAILTDDGSVYVGSDHTNWKTNNSLRSIPGHYRQIACGKFHILLIGKDDDHLYAIGGCGAGEITGDDDSYETLVDTKLENVSKISCGGVHSMALTKEGRFFTWGWNEFGQLGLNSLGNRTEPSLVLFPNIPSQRKIKDFCGGVCHSLVLFDDGTLYGFGSNAFCQIGISQKYVDVNMSPKKIPIENVVAVSTLWSYDCTIVFTGDHQCYSWGWIGHRKLKEPTKSKRQVESFADAAAQYLQASKQTPWTFGLTRLRNQPKILFRDRLMATIADWFDNPENYDFTFEVEGRLIFVQKDYLRMVSKYFEKMLSEQWCHKDLIRITTFPYDIFYAYLKMLHFGYVAITNENLPGLLDLAKCYLDQGLLDLCQHYLLDNISINNCYEYCQLAVKYDLEDVNDKFHKNLMLKHFTTEFQTKKFKPNEMVTETNVFKKFLNFYENHFLKDNEHEEEQEQL